MTEISEIPISNALAEAKVEESLSELTSRDPEGYQKQDIKRIIAMLREQRERGEEEKAPKGRKNKSSTQSDEGVVQKLLATKPQTSEDLGF